MIMDDFTQAIQHGDTQRVAELLVAQPALAAQRTPDGLSPLLLAVYSGQEEIARQIAVHLPGLDVFEAAALGDTPRLAALLGAHPELANAFAVDGFQPLGLACFFGHPETAHLLIERGANVDTPSANAQAVTPLHSAAASGQIEIARWLLAAGADPNAVQAGGFRPLHAAAQNGQAELIRLLLDYGADRGASAGGKTALDYARQSGQAEAVRLLE